MGFFSKLSCCSSTSIGDPDDPVENARTVSTHSFHTTIGSNHTSQTGSWPSNDTTSESPVTTFDDSAGQDIRFNYTLQQINKKEGQLMLYDEGIRRLAPFPVIFPPVPGRGTDPQGLFFTGFESIFMDNESWLNKVVQGLTDLEHSSTGPPGACWITWWKEDGKPQAILWGPGRVRVGPLSLSDETCSLLEKTSADRIACHMMLEGKLKAIVAFGGLAYSFQRPDWDPPCDSVSDAESDSDSDTGLDPDTQAYHFTFHPPPA